MDIETKNLIKNFEKDLYKWFEHAYGNRTTIDKLYERGKIIKEKIEKVFPNFYNIKNFSDLKDALGFIDELHDSDTRKYHSLHKEEIYYHMRRLA